MFSGIGAQHKALEIIKQKTKGKFDYDIVATSEWDVYANISYNAIHYNNENIAKKNNIDKNKIIEYLSKFTHSLDSKNPTTINKLIKILNEEKLELLYSAYKNSNNLGSISEIKTYQLKEILKVKKIDLITYSFPCQDLSVAGSFHGFNQGMKKNSGTRSGLLWEVERILKKLKSINMLPNYLLLENVRNMISKKHKNDYVEWISFLKSFGYKTKTFVLDAQFYGVPQHRERVYALSVLDDLDYSDTYFDNNLKSIIEKSTNINNVSKEFKINKNLDQILKVNYKNNIFFKEAIDAIPNDTPSRQIMFDNNYILYSNYKKTIDKRIIKKKLRLDYYKNKMNEFFYPISRTVTTKQDRNPNAGVIDLRNTILENYKNGKSKYRLITNREAYLLMGFSNRDFNKIKLNFLNKDVMYRQAGNSIVVNVLISIFIFIFKEAWKKDVTK